MKQRCENCRYFLIQETQVSICRRFPPTAVMATDQDGNPFYAHLFAEVSPGAWCGEWRPIDPPKVIRLTKRDHVKS